MMVSLTGLDGLIQAQGGTTETTGTLTVSPTTAEPGDTITVRASGFRVGTEASFIYTDTITIGGVPIASVASVETASGYLHAGRTIDGGTYIAEFVLPYNVANGDQEIKVISGWGGADESYPENGVAPCGTVGLGGGVKDRVATASIMVE